MKIYELFNKYLKKYTHGPSSILISFTFNVKT